MKKLLLLFLLVFGIHSAFATNDLVITSISRSSDCTTLKWISHTGAFYTVYWTDNLVPPVFWRVAQANVPSGGTNTTWREGCCTGESMMMSSMSSGGWSSLSEKEREEKLAAAQARAEEGIKFLTTKLQEATNSSGGSASLLSAPSPGGGVTKTSGVATVPTARFYRVAKIAAGFVDGWGGAFGAGRPAITNVIAVSASPRFAGVHGMALRADGTVTNWGANSFGQCNVPANLTDVIAVAAGGRHSVALKRNGSVTNWGDNTLGQLTNMPPNLTNVVDVKAGLWHTLALRADGTVAAWGDLYIRTNPVPAGLSGVIAISAGPRHNLALRCDGTVAAWGFTHTNLLNNFLPTNVPASLSNVIAISAGMEHNQALLANGTVVVWGRTNNPGVAGALVLTNVTALSAGWHYGTALFTDTTAQGWGQGDTEITMDSIIALSAGADHVLVVRTNDEAPVIRGHPRSVFPALGSTTNFSVTASSSTNLTYQWQRLVGTSWSNLVSATNTTLTFTNVQDSENGIYRAQVSTALRSIHSRTALLEVLHAPVIASQSPELVLRRPQFVTEILSVLITNQGARFLHYEWFQNGVSVPMAVGSTFFLYFNRTNSEGGYHVVVSNPAGSYTSQVWQASVTLHGEATLWGDDSYGQSSGRSRHETNLVAIAAGGYHTLGLRENGTVIAWGRNNRSQTDVPGGLTNVVALAGGYEHSVALLDDGTVRVWGEINYGQTPIPAAATNVTMIAGGGDQVLALRRDGQLLAWGVTPVPSGVSNIIAMSAGYEHALALHSNGTVQAWNNFGFPDMSAPGGLSNVVQLASGAYHALALKQDGTVTGWGGNGYGEATPPAGLSNVMKIVAGSYFSMALRNDGTVVSWGDNTYGQTTVPNGLGDIRDIAAGTDHSAALAYNPALEYPVNVVQDLLLICNTNVESVFVKDYYLQHRPLVSQANVLQIGYAPQETISRADFTNAIRTPVLNWLAENPTRRPKYWILFLDVPSRIHEITNIGIYSYDIFPPYKSVSYELSLLPQARSPFITHINMGNSNHIADTNACRAYIDKLAFFGSNYSPGKVVISASAGGYGNTNYYFDGVGFFAFGATQARSGVLAAGIHTNNVITRVTEPHIDRATNVSAYASSGVHGWQSLEYAVDGSVIFTGESSWYVMMTTESFNGWRFAEVSPHFQGHFIKWFSAGAFGGIDYWNTPVGAVTHTDEPHGSNINNPSVYFGYWALGKRFCVAAWKSRMTEHFQAIGDPLTKK